MISLPVLSDAHHLDKLGINSDELVNFLAATIVVLDLEQQGAVIAHKLLDITKVLYDSIHELRIFLSVVGVIRKTGIPFGHAHSY